MTEHSETPTASSTTSPADADDDSSTTGPDDATLAGVSDEQLPEDLRPTDDNPLAQPLDPDAEATKSADELGMDDTQDDTSGDYESSGDTPSTELDDELESEDGAGHGDGAQGAGISG